MSRIPLDFFRILHGTLDPSLKEKVRKEGQREAGGERRERKRERGERSREKTERKRERGGER